MESMPWPRALLILGAIVTVTSGLALLVRFSEADEAAVRAETAARLARARAADDTGRAPLPDGEPA
jgi:hypothetical protein